MNKQLITGFIFVFCTTLCHAEICPSVADIKKEILHDWKIYDSNDDKLLSVERVSSFKAQIKQFALAEWPDQDNKNETIHCYYLNKDGSTMDAYLAKNNLRPEISQKYWYKVTGSMQCAAGMDKCIFQRSLQTPQQFAKK